MTDLPLRFMLGLFGKRLSEPCLPNRAMPFPNHA